MRFMVDAPLRAVITTAHIAVPQLEFQRRRDLHIRAHLKHGLEASPGGVISSVCTNRDL